MNTPKYTTGQRIKHVNSPDSDAGEIIRFSYDPATGYTYTITLKDWDAQKRAIVDAVMHIQEDEAVLMTYPQGEETQNEEV